MDRWTNLQNSDKGGAESHSPATRQRISLSCTIVAMTFACITPLILAQSDGALSKAPTDRRLTFSIVSIKRHGNAPASRREGCYLDGCYFVARPLLAFIMVAYNLSQKPILGNPLPGGSDLFDLEAKIDPADMPSVPLSPRKLAEMLQPVLADRFALRAHHETRIMPVYNIVLAKGGLRMKESAHTAQVESDNTTAANPTGGCIHKSVGSGLRIEHDCTMTDIRNILEGPAGRYLVDKTGLTGHYDLELHWADDNAPSNSALPTGASFFTAIQEQLGMKLESARAPVDVLVIDSAQSPAPN